MMQPEMTDEEARQQVERTDAFIAAFRELIASTSVDPASPSRLPAIAGLERIAATVDAVDYITFCNLANLNTALRGGLLDLIEVQLMCVGGGPTLDFQDAAEFLAVLQPMIDMALNRRLQ
jgi:MoxR-like ATPase